MNTIAAQNFGDIFYLRERMIQDILHKNNLVKIKSRISDINSNEKIKKTYEKRKKKKSKKENLNENKDKDKDKYKDKIKKSSEFILPTIIEKLNTNTEENNSCIEENYCNKKILSLGNSPRIYRKEDYAERYKESKRRFDRKKLQEIQKENEYFVQKLQKVNSILNKNKLDNSYEKFECYKNIAKNTKPIKEVQKKADNVKEHLPPIIFDKKIPVNYIYC
jgi:hypothetical protein